MLKEFTTKLTAYYEAADNEEALAIAKVLKAAMIAAGYIVEIDIEEVELS